MLKRARLWQFALSCLALFAGCGSCGHTAAPVDAGQAELEAPTGRLLILGFDGVDPRWLRRWADEGKLPHLASMLSADQGSHFRPLRSTNPPQSPVAWASFSTGMNPGDHGIFDFIGRRLITSSSGPPVLPFPATTSFEPQASGPPVATNLRTGVPFWKTLSDDGVAVEVINVPYSFPPDPMRNGRMLSGLGVPDLRETNSTFVYAGTDITPERAARPPGGGVLVPLRVEAGRASFSLQGPTRPGHAPERLALNVELRVGEPAGGLTVTVGEEQRALTAGEMSDFVPLVFREGTTEIHGLARFLCLEAGENVRLFVTPISFDPRRPYSPISYPNGYAARVAESLGHVYKTVGWDHDTSALNDEVIDEGEFLREMNVVETDRRAMLDDALRRDDWRLLTWVSTSTDRVAHMFYRLIDPEHPRYDAALAARYGDAIEREYRRMDETVGHVLEQLRPADTLLIISDHGFHDYRWGLHVNQWLRQRGLLTLRGGAESSPREFLLDVDWSQTKAYALGTGQIYLNMRGRERDGIVSAEDAPALLQQIRAGLEALTDESHAGRSIVRRVYLGSEIFAGGRHADAPDLQIAFEEYYRTSWETILGGVPAGLVADNPRKWSGDHAASDVRDTPGILLSNRALVAEPGIVDLAPTALRFFHQSVPANYVGQSVLAQEAP
ncbi:MAG: hypothetical protein GXP55_02160 [Deltaproteobacteria bacterium]|nr:hypothetical protein [Deltaproteobacteria bacterium]